MFIFRRRYICPYCLAEIRGGKSIPRCPVCKKDLPVQYIEGFEDNPPFFVQVFGWSQVGKTVFLYALTLMLIKMNNVWPAYMHSAATDETQRTLQDIQTYLANGKMPEMTPLGEQDVYIMILRKMERWGGRALVMRDCAGEIFDDLEVPVDQAPYLLNAPTTFMLISLPDLITSGRRSIDMLMNNYINTLLKHKVDFRKECRKLVVVLTKADLIKDLPINLRNYLISDPLWASVNQSGPIQQMKALEMQEYIETMSRVSDEIQWWIGSRDAYGKNFIRLAEDRNIDLRFSLISSTGAEVGADGKMQQALAPHRILDPYFWALELQSRP